ncbi:protein SRG1 [Citrus sinensis]|uniref:Protein SRG1 n=1 Tax=Citrus sinensis TaxID=2711 RepID=A0ACB8M1H7_CITSI|nr:protein SRG1 [Citrus sinensis]
MERLGGFLPVPYVQELAKKPMAVVPPIYMRPKGDTPTISNGTLNSKIPVINMQSLYSEESMDSELAKLDFACKQSGLFQKEIKEFFYLSMEEKKKYWQYPGEVEGFGQASFLTIKDEELTGFFENGMQSLRMNDYPLYPVTPLPNNLNLAILIDKGE